MKLDTASAPTTDIRPLRSGMRVLLVVATVLVFLAGTQLYVFAGRTAKYFAWTIDPPMTAVFLGASYWAAVALEGGAARRRAWADARIAVPAVFTFTTLTLIITILQRDRLHLQSTFSGPTRAVTWAWIFIYAVVPVLMLILIVDQMRARGVDPPRTAPLPMWLRTLAFVQGLAMLALGLQMYVLAVRSNVGDVWPWALTPLTEGAIGAWLIGLGLAAVQAAGENDAHRIRPAADAYIVFACLNVVALLRYGDALDWSSFRAWAFVAFLASTLVAGIAAARLDRSRRPRTSAAVVAR